MADNGLLPRDIAASIAKVKGLERTGIRSGNWLSVAEAEVLLNVPSYSSFRGKRDRALLGILIGAGLRRAEAAGLLFAHIQEQDGRWMIAGLIGKRGRIRTVPDRGLDKGARRRLAAGGGLTEGLKACAIEAAIAGTPGDCTASYVQPVEKAMRPSALGGSL